MADDTLNQIENHTTYALKIYLSLFDNVSIIPGINLIPQKVLNKLNEHPQFAKYIEHGILSLVRAPDVKIDDRTNLGYVNQGEEIVPVQYAIVNNKMEPLQKNTGHFFKLNDITKIGISTIVAQNIVKFVPSEGWRDAEHIITALELETSSTDISKVKELF